MTNKPKNEEIHGIPDKLEDWRIVDSSGAGEPKTDQEYVWVNCIDERTGEITKAPIRLQVYLGEGD